MNQPGEGDLVRIDIPDEMDPDHDSYHGEHGTVVAILKDDADIWVHKKPEGCVTKLQFSCEACGWEWTAVKTG
jgi:hypothetical protein